MGTKIHFHFSKRKKGLQKVHGRLQLLACQKSVKTRKAFPASHALTVFASPSPPKHITGVCHRGNMERESTLVQSFYYGGIGSQATESLLKRFGHEGSFLLRDSSTVHGAYCLCVRKSPFVHTYRLINSTAGWTLQVSGIRLQSFRTLETLIESFRGDTAPRVGLVPLTDPLDKTQLQDLGNGMT
ncbi:hypothetical protein PAMA_005395 [Pampus argenteus]